MIDSKTRLIVFGSRVNTKTKTTQLIPTVTQNTI